MHDTFCHKEFHDVASSCSGKVMITYNSNETLRKSYSSPWNQKEWDLTYTMVSSKKYREDQHKKLELLLWNYDVQPKITLDDFF